MPKAARWQVLKANAPQPKIGSLVDAAMGSKATIRCSKGCCRRIDAAGIKKQDISILSEEFLAEVRNLPQRKLAVELLQKLLQGDPAARPAQPRAGAFVCRPR